MSETIAVVDRGRSIAFSFDDLLDYHGPGSPGGVAHAFKVLERALPLLAPDGPPERRELEIRTAFGGPGARDGFELVTRAVSGDRYVVDPSMALPGLGGTRERFVFRLGYRGSAVTLTLREGYVTEEFVALAGKDGRTSQEESHLDTLKLELADRLMSAAATEVYDVTASD